MGLPLSITNRIRFRGAPSSKRMVFSSRGFPQQGMGFLHRIPLFHQRMEFASITSPSPKRTVSHPKGQPLQANRFRIKTVTLSQTNGIRTRESPSPREWGSHQGGHLLHSEWGSLLTSGLVAIRDPFQGILLPGHASQGIPFPKGLRLYL